MDQSWQGKRNSCGCRKLNRPRLDEKEGGEGVAGVMDLQESPLEEFNIPISLTSQLFSSKLWPKKIFGVFGEKSLGGKVVF